MEHDLTKLPIQKMVIKMALPMVLGIMSIIGFNLIDTFYLGNYGEDELAAISFTFPVVAFFASIALGVATATSSLVSRALGERNTQLARRYTSDSLTFALILVLISVIVGVLTVRPLFQLLGAEGRVLELIEQYMLIWYSGIVFITVPMVGNGAIRAMGDTKTAAKIMIISAIINAILDPILIFGKLGFPSLGIQGAAIANVLARAMTLVASLYILHFKYNLIDLHRPSIKDAMESWKKILYIAVPAAGTNVITPLVASMTTAVVAKMGPYNVAALGIVTKVESFVLIIIFALSSAIGPIIGQNFGAKESGRVQEAFKFAGLISVGWSIVVSVVLLGVGDGITAMFNSNDQIVQAASKYYWFVPISFGLMGVRVMGCSLFNATGRPLTSTFIILSHMFLLYAPLVFLLSGWWQMQGVYVAMSAANFLSGLLTLFIIQSYFYNQERL